MFFFMYNSANFFIYLFFIFTKKCLDQCWVICALMYIEQNNFLFTFIAPYLLYCMHRIIDDRIEKSIKGRRICVIA